MNLQEIADRAGVSRMTVSRALRNQPRVSEQTRQRILQIAQEVGYQANPMVSAWMSHVAQSRSTHDKPTLVYVYPSSLQAEKTEIMGSKSSYYAGVQQRASQLGFELEALQLGAEGMSARRFSSILTARGIQGIIVAPVLAPMRGRSYSLHLDWEAFSSVAIGYSMISPQIHRVCLDYYNGLLEGLETLWRKGFRKFGLYLQQETDERVRHLWTSAFLTFHWIRGLSVEGKILVYNGLDRDGFSDWFRRLRPEVLISHRDEWITGWYTDTLQQMRHSCFFVHLDVDQMQTDVADAGFPGCRVAMGATATELLVGQIKRGERGIPQEPQTCLIKPTLIFCQDRQV